MLPAIAGNTTKGQGVIMASKTTKTISTNVVKTLTFNRKAAITTAKSDKELLQNLGVNTCIHNLGTVTGSKQWVRYMNNVPAKYWQDLNLKTSENVLEFILTEKHSPRVMKTACVLIRYIHKVDEMLRAFLNGELPEDKAAALEAIGRKLCGEYGLEYDPESFYGYAWSSPIFLDMIDPKGKVLTSKTGNDGTNHDCKVSRMNLCSQILQIWSDDSKLSNSFSNVKSEIDNEFRDALNMYNCESKEFKAAIPNVTAEHRSMFTCSMLWGLNVALFAILRRVKQFGAYMDESDTCELVTMPYKVSKDSTTETVSFF